MKKLYFALFLLLLVFLMASSALALDLSSKGAVLLEADSGSVLYGENENARLPMASTTKIMTAITVLDNFPIDAVVKIPKDAVGIEGSSIYLCEGEELTIEELLYALMLESANDASVALAYATAGSVEDFVSLMNKKALELGLDDTHFENPHGLDGDQHYTTAKDLGILSCYAMKNPKFSEIVSTYKRVIPLNNGEGSRVLINHNKLLRSYDGAIGIKTGFTKKSGRCLVSCAERDGVMLVAVTLNAPNDWQDHKKMLDYGFERLVNVKLADRGDYVFKLDVVNGTKDYVLATNTEPLDITLFKDNLNISARLEYNRLLPAPISIGDYLGRIVFSNNDEDICSLELFATESVKNINYKKSLLERLFG